MEIKTKRISTHIVAVEQLPEAPVILDLGACYGSFSIEMLRLFPKAEIWAYEPNRDAINVFRGNPTLENVPLIESAVVGNKTPPGQVEFTSYPGKYWEWSNMCDLYTSRLKNYHHEDHWVNTVNINTILGQHDHIDYVKMDIEGAEKDVMDSITPENFKKISQMCIEIHDGVSPEDISRILINHGFGFHFLSEDNITGEMFAIRSSVDA